MRHLSHWLWRHNIWLIWCEIDGQASLRDITGGSKEFQGWVVYHKYERVLQFHCQDLDLIRMHIHEPRASHAHNYYYSVTIIIRWSWKPNLLYKFWALLYCGPLLNRHPSMVDTCDIMDISALMSGPYLHRLQYTSIPLVVLVIMHICMYYRIHIHITWCKSSLLAMWENWTRNLSVDPLESVRNYKKNKHYMVPPVRPTFLSTPEL